MGLPRGGDTEADGGPICIQSLTLFSLFFLNIRDRIDEKVREHILTRLDRKGVVDEQAPHSRKYQENNNFCSSPGSRSGSVVFHYPPEPSKDPQRGSFDGGTCRTGDHVCRALRWRTGWRWRSGREARIDACQGCRTTGGSCSNGAASATSRSVSASLVGEYPGQMVVRVMRAIVA